MHLIQGTREEHIGTLKRAKANGINYVWSGDVRRNPYLAENLNFGANEGFITLTDYESDQESGWNVKWTGKEIK